MEAWLRILTSVPLMLSRPLVATVNPPVILPPVQFNVPLTLCIPLSVPALKVKLLIGTVNKMFAELVNWIVPGPLQLGIAFKVKVPEVKLMAAPPAAAKLPSTVPPTSNDSFPLKADTAPLLKKYAWMLLVPVPTDLRSSPAL